MKNKKIEVNYMLIKIVLKNMEIKKKKIFFIS